MLSREQFCCFTIQLHALLGVYFAFPISFWNWKRQFNKNSNDTWETFWLLWSIIFQIQLFHLRPLINGCREYFKIVEWHTSPVWCNTDHCRKQLWSRLNSWSCTVLYVCGSGMRFTSCHSLYYITHIVYEHLIGLFYLWGLTYWCYIDKKVQRNVCMISMS